jgi:hypothetical protein
MEICVFIPGPGKGWMYISFRPDSLDWNAIHRLSGEKRPVLRKRGLGHSKRFSFPIDWQDPEIPVGHGALVGIKNEVPIFRPVIGSLAL